MFSIFHIISQGQKNTAFTYITFWLMELYSWFSGPLLIRKLTALMIYSWNNTCPGGTVVHQIPGTALLLPT